MITRITNMPLAAIALTSLLSGCGALDENEIVTGDVTISGDALEDSTLTLTQNLVDLNGLGTFRYQWYRDGLAITGATSKRYTLVYNDVGTDISVTISFTDKQGTAESSSSNVISNIAHVNHPVTGAVVISGDALEDSKLTLTQDLDDADGLGTFNYQWLRDGVPINGATGENYTLAYNDVGTDISVTMSFTDALGAAESSTSNAISNIAHVNHAVTGNVVISGDALEDSTLFINHNLTDADGLGAFSYQWLRDGVAINGATSGSYILAYIDVGTEVSVTISFTDALGTAESSISNVISNIAHVNHPVTGTVLISGDALEDSTLALTQNLADADGLGSFKYQWYRDGMAISGATNESYTLAYIDVGTDIMVAIDFTDALGAAELSVSNVISNIAHVNHPVSGTVVISGDALEDSTLTLTQDLADADGLGDFNYQWLRDGVIISGATSESYTLVYEDVDTDISATISFTDTLGAAESSTSNVISNIAHVNHAATGSLTISGDLVEKQTLTVTHDLADSDGLSGAISLQWLRDGVEIDTATSNSYTILPSDIGARLHVLASYTDDLGALEKVSSTSTTEITGQHDVLVMITGYNEITTNASQDSGVSWGGETAMFGSNDVYDQYESAMASDGKGNIIMVWDSETLTPTTSDIIYSYSNDDGTTWSDPALLNPADSTIKHDKDPNIETNGQGRWIASWSSEEDIASNGIDGDVVYVVSDDNGLTWTAPKMLNHYATSDSANDRYINIRNDGGNNWLATWSGSYDLNFGDGNDLDIFASRSNDNGETWTDAYVINSNGFSDTGIDYIPGLVMDKNGNAIVVWGSNDPLGNTVGSDMDVMAAYSVDYGQSWSEAMVINSHAQTDSIASDYYTSVAMDDNGNAVVVYQSDYDLTNNTKADIDIHAVHSTDFGASWSDSQLLNSNGMDDSEGEYYPTIVTDKQGNWVTTWTGYNPYSAISKDNGATWSERATLGEATSGYENTTVVIH